MLLFIALALRYVPVVDDGLHLSWSCSFFLFFGLGLPPTVNCRHGDSLDRRRGSIAGPLCRVFTGESEVGTGDICPRLNDGSISFIPNLEPGVRSGEMHSLKFGLVPLREASELCRHTHAYNFNVRSGDSEASFRLQV